MQSKPKNKKCKQCKALFSPSQPLQYVCGYKCAIEYKKLLEAKKWDIEKKAIKEKLLTHKDYIKLLQVVFNTYIRLRDSELPCISCGVYQCEEFHAGHYVATTYQYHRFNELNVWKQCSRCNTHLRGNLIPYRIELINRIGLKGVEEIENTRHKTLEITIPEIKEQITKYKQLIKQLKK